MKVKARNLIHGLLLAGLPLMTWADDRAEVGTQLDSGATARAEAPALAAVETEFDVQTLADALAADPVLQESLREHLRAWTDRMESLQRQQFAGAGLPETVLARS